MDFDVIDIDVLIMLLLLMTFGFFVHVVHLYVVFLVFFVLLKAFAILVKCLLVVIQSFGVFFLLAIICGRLVALLCIRVEVWLSCWLDRVLQSD